MFCPKCSAQNTSQQKYCRQCGQELTGVWLALDGSVPQSLEKLKASEKWIQGGAVTLVVFSLIGIAITILGIVINTPALSFSALINLLLGLFIGLPLIYLGQKNLKRAARLLTQASNEAKNSQLDRAPQTNKLSGKSSDLQLFHAPDSVTENPTLHLEALKRMPHQRD